MANIIITKSGDTAHITIEANGRHYTGQAALAYNGVTYIPAAIDALTQLAIADQQQEGANARAAELRTFREGLAAIVREAIDAIRPTCAPPAYAGYAAMPDGPDLTTPTPDRPADIDGQ